MLLFGDLYIKEHFYHNNKGKKTYYDCDYDYQGIGKVFEVTISKYAAEGTIPAMRVGRVWRFDKETIDNWISEGQSKSVPKGSLKRRKK